MKQLDFEKEALPLYVQLKNIIKEDIETEVYKFEDTIPSELEFQNLYDVSRITVRQAILSLEKDGYVKRARGKGTKVIYRKDIEENLSSIKSFTDEMKERGLVPGTSYVHVEKVIATKEIASIFGIPDDSAIICLKRIRTANDVPIVCFETYFPPKYNFPLEKDKYNGSMYQLYDELGVKKPVRAKENIKAIIADNEIIDLLDLDKKTAILLRTRISYNSNNEVIEYTISYYKGDKYSYSIELVA